MANARPLHVAFCVYPGLLIHAAPKGGVQPLFFEDRNGHGIDFTRAYGSVVLRLPDLTIGTFHLLRSMLFWSGAFYTFKFHRPATAIVDATYSSQLAFDTLKAAGLDEA